MNKKYNIEFSKSETPIVEPITKFGGQPVWLGKPQWPLSEELGIPMRFICQISLDKEIFPGCKGKVAYLFMTEEDDECAETWDPESGENAVIIQPRGKFKGNVERRITGPSREEYSVKLIAGADPDFIDEMTLREMNDDVSTSYHSSLAGNKIGGTPGFTQADEIPEPENNWSLLLQLDSCNIPFGMNFGASGTAYAFIDKKGTEGKFLWQE